MVAAGNARNGRLARAALLAFLCACDARQPPPIPENAVAPEGPETWQVDRKTFSVEATYYEQRIDEGGWVYTVQHACESCPKAPGSLSAEEAMKAAEPLLRYAMEQGRYQRRKMTGKAGAEEPVARIAVILYEPGWFRRSLNRVSKPVEQIPLTPGNP